MSVPARWRDRLAGRRRASLLRARDAQSRSLTGVVAILTFLAALAAGIAGSVVDGTLAWRRSLVAAATIQVRPRTGRDPDADASRAAELARRVPGIAAADPLSRADTEATLAPWLGHGLDLSALPVPRLVALRLLDTPAPDLAAFAERLRAEIPGAGIDDHSAALARTARATTVLLVAALGFLGCVGAAAALAVAFATRGVVAGNQDTVAILGLMGADRRFVIRAVAGRFLSIGALGAALGVAGALICLLALSRLPEAAGLAGAAAGYGAAAAVGLASVALVTAVSLRAAKGFVGDTSRW